MVSILELAIQKAGELPKVRNQQRHYSIVTDKRGRIVSEAANSYVKTSPVMKRSGCKVGKPEAIYLHSEVLALSRDKHRKGVKLYVARVGADGKPLYSAPCCICAEYLKEYPNIKSVEFST